MATTPLTAVIVLLAVALAAYLTGWQAGNRDGFQKGKDAGSKENTDKAFAVGYDRGKREQEDAQKKPPPKSGDRVWWAWAALTVAIVIGLELIVGGGRIFR